MQWGEEKVGLGEKNKPLGRHRKGSGEAVSSWLYRQAAVPPLVYFEGQSAVEGQIP